MFRITKPVIVFAFLILSGGVVFVWSQGRQAVIEESPPEVRGVEKETAVANLILDYGDEKVATYSGVRVEGKTVLGLLLQAATDHDFEVDYTPPSGEMGAFVKTIGEVANTNEKFWQFWINGEYGQVAMDQQEIKDGDLVEIKFRGFE